MSWFKNRERHSLASRGIKTNRPRIKLISEQDQIKSRYVLLPEILYHGTSVENAEKILKEGFKVRTPKDQNWKSGEVTKDYGFYDDTFYNVSLAKKEKDAIFFTVAQFGHTLENGRYKAKTQVIFEIDSSKLEPQRLVARDLFNTKGGEIKHIGPISSSAIKRIHIRQFQDVGKTFKIEDHYYNPHDSIPWETLK